MKPKMIKTKCYIKHGDKYLCKYCEKSYKENVTRMALHIKKECTKVPKHILDNFSSKHLRTYVEKPNEENSCSNLTNSTCTLTPPEVESENSKVSCQQSVLNFVDTMSNEEKLRLDELMARAIFSSTVPFSIVENTHWINFFKALRPSYTPPSRYVLSKRLLNNEYERISCEVNNKIKNSKVYGIQIDGWSNIRNESIMNIIVTTPKPFVFKTIDCNTERHTGEYIATELGKVIDDLDRNKCLGVVTDNASSMKKAWILLQKDDRYKNLPIAFYSCICHTLNLLIADIIKLKSCKEIEKKSKNIVKNIISSHILKANFTNIQKTKKIDCSLKLPVKTRWGSLCICLKSLHKNKNVLQQLSVSEDLSVIERLDKSVKQSILSDEFWELVESIITLISPITIWITKLESDIPRLSDVPAALNDIKNNVMLQMSTSPLLLEEQNILNEAFDKRYDMAIHPIHYAANVLDPKYQGKDLPQGCDVEGIVYIQKVADKLLTPNEYNKIIIELAEYRSHEGLWAKDILWNNIDDIEARIWWNGLCSNTSLSKVASAILSLPASSAATERSFSSYSLIHTKRRNRLTNLTAKKLLFIYEHINNLDLEMSKHSKPVKSVQTNQESLTINNDNDEGSCSYQACSSSSENEEETEEYYNTDDIVVESEGDQFGETDSSDDDFFNSIKPTLA